MSDEFEDIETHYQSAIIQTNETLQDAMDSLINSQHQAHSAIEELRAHVVHLYRMIQNMNTFYGTSIQRLRQNEVLLMEVLGRIETRLDGDTE